MTPKSSAERQRERRAILDAIAQKSGYPSWAVYETNVKNGLVQIQPIPKAPNN